MLVQELRDEIEQLKAELQFYKAQSQKEHSVPFSEIESFLSGILDFVPHHIVFIDGNGIITLCNMQAAMDLNIERDHIIGKHIRELLQIPDEQIIMLETLRTGKIVENKEVLDRNYGIMTTRIIKSKDGSISRVVGLFHFLNHIKAAEKQALAGRIAAGIAHEVRNPLTTVRGYLQFLEDKVEPETSQLFSKLLIPEIDRANKIISDFLRIVKPAEPSEELLEVNDFLVNYLGNFLHSESLFHNGTINFEIEEASSSCMFSGDREELFQVFINLFQNSLQGKLDGPLKVTITTKKQNNKIIIGFQDNGPGIPPNLLQHVFEPFFTTKDTGTGLGLSVSRKIIENHHGEMNVLPFESGAFFEIILPLSDKS